MFSLQALALVVTPVCSSQLHCHLLGISPPRATLAGTNNIGNVLTAVDINFIVLAVAVVAIVSVVGLVPVVVVVSVESSSSPFPKLG